MVATDQVVPEELRIARTSLSTLAQLGSFLGYGDQQSNSLLVSYGGRGLPLDSYLLRLNFPTGDCSFGFSICGFGLKIINSSSAVSPAPPKKQLFISSGTTCSKIDSDFAICQHEYKWR